MRLEFIFTFLFSIFLISNFTFFYLFFKIFIQKLDHSAIFINTAISITQYCVFSLRSYRVISILLTWILCIWGIYQIFSLKKQPFHHIITSSPFLFILPLLSQSMTNYQLFLLITTWIQVFIGFIVYSLKRPILWPEYFGSHEIFHLFTITAAITSVLLQYNLLILFEEQYCLFITLEN